jgi:hypothetical protein
MMMIIIIIIIIMVQSNWDKDVQLI